MSQTTPLAERLRAQEAALEAAIPAESFATLAEAADEMGREDHAGRALRPGEAAPDFTLPDAEGNPVALGDLLRDGPVVATFFRGTWCPYCNVQLHAYQQSYAEIRNAGATLVAISPQTPDQSQVIAEHNRLAFPVLSDAGNAVARRYVPVFVVADAPREAMRGIGVSLSEYNGDESNELPVPGTFVIDRDGIVRLAHVEGDFRKRLDPREILESLRAL